jgi:hypothetical protein
VQARSQVLRLPGRGRGGRRRRAAKSVHELGREKIDVSLVVDCVVDSIAFRLDRMPREKDIPAETDANKWKRRASRTLDGMKSAIIDTRAGTSGSGERLIIEIVITSATLSMGNDAAPATLLLAN